ncbi:response regulator [Paenibacillus sp. BC26]|uniref:response regulator transcription factor n=1 Tax=Paenibacillus sp. BC26 TaxID=1881032 RepID=UPI0008F39243|nr:response regulator [Paenibacillus sp. BC26]SFS46814.1 two-component system, response regulator YesN [Paenibacillus sp. BC26]
MINLMIVDDEPLVRLVLRHMITSQHSDIHIVGEASDGQEAIHFITEHQDIDIVCVDIQMPKMNGLQFLQQLGQLERAKPVYPIVLSAFNDYDYVREAFINGAKDYMLKANMDEAYLAPILSKAVNEVMKHKGATPVQAAVAEADMPALPDKNLEPLLISLLNLEPLEASARNEASAELKAVLGEVNLIAASVKLSQISLNESSAGFIKQTIRTVLDSQAIPAVILDRLPKEYTLLMAFPHQRSETSARENIHGMLTTISVRLKQFINASVAIGVSGWGRNSCEWLDLAEQSSKAAELSYYRGFDKVFFPEAVPVSKPSLEKSAGSQSFLDQLRMTRAEAVKSLKESDTVQWKMQYTQFRMLLMQADSIKPEVIKSEFTEMVWEIGAILYPSGLRWQQLQEGFSNPLDFIEQFNTMRDSLQWMEDMLGKIHGLIHEHECKQLEKYSLPVAKAKTFLDKHYCEDITLPSISQMVGVSGSYLSKQFSKEVGSSFIQYLTRLRIEEAKRLMGIGMKVSEVSDRVGYMNPEHFSRIFKKITGHSPKTHRSASSVM